MQVCQWKKEIQTQCTTFFEGKRGRGGAPLAEPTELERLYSEVYRPNIELDWHKKVRDQPAIIRQSWIDEDDVLSQVRQCSLAGFSRTKIDAQQKFRCAPQTTLAA